MFQKQILLLYAFIILIMYLLMIDAFGVVDEDANCSLGLRFYVIASN